MSVTRTPSLIINFRTRSSWQSFAALVVYTLGAILITLPLVANIGTSISDYGDPLVHTWKIGWSSLQLLNDPLNLYNAPIFFPYPNTLAFSNNFITQALIALPIVLATGNFALGLNLNFFLAFLLNGWGLYLLLRQAQVNFGGALIGGFIFAFGHFHLNQITHLGLLSTQWLPFTLLAFNQILRAQRPRDFLLFGVFLWLAVNVAIYYAFFTAAALVIYGALALFLARGRFPRRLWLGLAATVGIVFVLTLPFMVPYVRLSNSLGLKRDYSELVLWQAVPSSYLSSMSQHEPFRSLSTPLVNAEAALLPGIFALLLALYGLTQPRGRAASVGFVAIALLGLVLSFGPSLTLGTLTLPMPYQFFYDYVPGVANAMRVTARWGMLVLFGVAGMAGIGCGILLGKMRRPYAATALVLLLLCGLTIEYDRAPLGLVTLETGAQVPAVYSWLKAQPAGNLIELPTRIGDIEPLTRAMYFTLFHKHGLPIGYSGYIPATQDDFLQTLNAALDAPSPRLANLLSEFDVRYIVLHLNADDAPALQSALDQAPSITSVYQDETDRVYQVNAVPPAHPLQFSCLAPTYAAPNAPFTLYLTAQHNRRYPIVNTDLDAKTVTLEWSSPNAPTLTQTQTIRLPYVLPERISGVPITVNAPPAGDYTLTCSLDRQTPLTPPQSVRVMPTLPSNPSASPLELLNVQTGTENAKPGGEIISTFFWRRHDEIRTPVSMRVQMVDAEGNILSEIEREPVLYTYPVRLWRDNELVADGYALPIPADIPAGTYHLAISAVDSETGAPFTFRVPDGTFTTQFSTAPFTVP